MSPADARAYYGAGLCYARNGLMPYAATQFYHAVWYDGQNPVYRRALAHAYKDMKQYADAAEQYRKLAELIPAEAEPYLERGRCFVLLGRDGEAVELLKHAVAADSTCGDAYFLMGLAHEHARQPNLAVEAWRKAVLCDTDGKLARKAQRAIERLRRPPTTRPAAAAAAAAAR
jgi:tetratricopeptide (TPR) repeat protein